MGTRARVRERRLVTGGSVGCNQVSRALTQGSSKEAQLLWERRQHWLGETRHGSMSSGGGGGGGGGVDGMKMNDPPPPPPPPPIFLFL